MEALLQFSLEYRTISCYKCGLIFAVPTPTYNRWVDDSSKMWFCPMGHEQHFVEGAKQRLEKELASEKKRHEWTAQALDTARKSRDQQERRARAYKAVATKTKKRIGNGVCPCCNRTFQNLMNHMKSKHPKYQVKK